MGHSSGDTAAAKKVGSEHAHIGGGFYDTFKKNFRFLGGIIYSLICLGVKRINISPNIIDRSPLHILQKTFYSWPSSGSKHYCAIH